MSSVWVYLMLIKVRPILVRFDTRADVTNVITHWRLVPKSVYISYDFTKLQRDRFNLLKNQAKVFNGGEANRRNNKIQFVRFHNGNPVLVTAPSLCKERSAGNNDSGGSAIEDTKNM